MPSFSSDENASVVGDWIMVAYGGSHGVGVGLNEDACEVLDEIRRINPKQRKFRIRD